MFTDIKYQANPVSYQIVFEEHRVAKYCGMTWVEYNKLKKSEKVILVAYYRSEIKLDIATHKLSSAK